MIRGARYSFHLLGQAAEAARSARTVEAYVTGGALTEALTAVGDVHFRSAIDHLRQAQQSPRPAARVADAASEMQTAYFAFETSLGRGVRSLRPFIAPRRLQDTRGKAAGSAASVALLLFHRGEHPQNLRIWLDRVAHQTAENWRDWRARDRQDWWGYSLGWWDTDVVFDVTMPLTDYFELESSLLPPAMVRPPPPAHMPRPELDALGVELPRGWQKIESYVVPKYERR